MGLFDAKYCSICGEKIGFLGNRKLEDGNLCKNCASKLSPFFSDRRNSTVEEIKQQLEYREQNKQKVKDFNITKTLGDNQKIFFDENNKQFIVSYYSRFDENPDVIDFKDVTGCNLIIDENKSEIYTKDKEGKRISYKPPRYKYSYDFDLTIYVNNPYFNEIKIQINGKNIESKTSPEYEQYQKIANEIEETFKGIQEKAKQENSDVTYTCPACNAVTKPNNSGCCPYCGSKLV